MDAQELRNLQEAYMEVVENQQLDEGYKNLPYEKMMNKSNKFDKQYKTGPTKTDAEYKSTTDARRRSAGTHLAARFHIPKISQEKSAANKNRPETEKRSKTVEPKKSAANKNRPETEKRSKTVEPKKSFPNRLTRSDRKGIRDSYDYYDIILSHLLDEGYAETPEAAESIMVNMSEEWRDSIIG